MRSEIDVGTLFLRPQNFHQVRPKASDVAPLRRELLVAELVSKLGSKAEAARELAYRLYTICERKKRAAEALSYNGLVQSWPEITRLVRTLKALPAQTDLFEREAPRK